MRTRREVYCGFPANPRRLEQLAGAIGETASTCGIFSANMDPVTPPKYGEQVARYLPNSKHVVIPQAGHGVDGLTDPGCIDRIAIEFLDKGDAKNLDVSCVDQMAPPPFVTK